jgi:hypothetical protein
MKRKILFARLWSITTSISNKGQSVTVVNFPILTLYPKYLI